MNIVAVLPLALQARGNNLAEGLAKVQGSGIETFDICPRVLDAQGNTVLWTNFQRDVTTLDDSDYFQQLDPDAQQLLGTALTLTPEMMVMEVDEDGELIPRTQPAIGKLIIAPNMDPQFVLSWLGLSRIEER